MSNKTLQKTGKTHRVMIVSQQERRRESLQTLVKASLLCSEVFYTNGFSIDIGGKEYRQGATGPLPDLAILDGCLLPVEQLEKELSAIRTAVPQARIILLVEQPRAALSTLVQQVDDVLVACTSDELLQVLLNLDRRSFS